MMADDDDAVHRGFWLNPIAWEQLEWLSFSGCSSLA
jgi:hypothetical protein